MQIKFVNLAREHGGRYKVSNPTRLVVYKIYN